MPPTRELVKTKWSRAKAAWTSHPEARGCRNEMRWPEGQETIRYGMPAVMVGDRYGVHFAGWKKHVALYPVPSFDEPLKSRVSPYRSGKDTVPFAMRRNAVRPRWGAVQPAEPVTLPACLHELGDRLDRWPKQAGRLSRPTPRPRPFHGRVSRDSVLPGAPINVARSERQRRDQGLVAPVWSHLEEAERLAFEVLDAEDDPTSVR